MRRRWTAAEDALLGKAPARDVARQLGRSLHSVLCRQCRLGIPAAPHPAAWTAEEDALLGTDTDGQVARRLGRPRNSVRSRRQRLGIPPAADPPPIARSCARCGVSFGASRPYTKYCDDCRLPAKVEWVTKRLARMTPEERERFRAQVRAASARREADPEYRARELPKRRRWKAAHREQVRRWARERRQREQFARDLESLDHLTRPNQERTDEQ